ncbi:MAG: hypothetical protein U1E73_03960 [Planctomycetota bacterium]
MSANESETPDPSAAATAPADAAPAEGKQLTDLMASGDVPKTARPDLDAEALRLAKEAIAEGERALAAARAQLAQRHSPPSRRGRRLEFALRMLLAANVLAMLLVIAMPSLVPSLGQSGEVAHAPTPTNTGHQPPAPPGPKVDDRYNQALLLSDRGDFAGAIDVLEKYLKESPRMAPSRLINIYQSIAYYASACGRVAQSEEYQRKAQAVTQSHQLPDDLVETAKAALASGDQESLRRIWARFLLIQREIPPSLYQHVAEAYLQLGDSYRLQANEAADKARVAEIERANALLREQGQGKEAGKK